MIDLTHYEGVYFTPQEAAERMGLTSGRLYQMLRANEIDAVKIGDRFVLIPEVEVDRIRDQKHSVGRPRVSKLAG